MFDELEHIDGRGLDEGEEQTLDRGSNDSDEESNDSDDSVPEGTLDYLEQLEQTLDREKDKSYHQHPVNIVVVIIMSASSSSPTSSRL